MDHLFTLHNSEGRKFFLPLDSVLKDDAGQQKFYDSQVPQHQTQQPSHQDVLQYQNQPVFQQPHLHSDPGSNQINLCNLEKGSLILYGDPPLSGTVMWMGYLPEMNNLFAGIEMVSENINKKFKNLERE